MDRITEHRLRDLLIFSPYNMGGMWKLDHQQGTIVWSKMPAGLEKGIAANALELCVDGNPRYRPCGTRDIDDPNFFANAEKNVTMNEESWSALNRITVPNELQRILKQYHDSLSFYNSLEARRLKYLQTAFTAVLSEPISGIDPSRECSATPNANKPRNDSPAELRIVTQWVT